MARTAKPKQAKTLEQRLWDAADALRGNQEPSEYKHVVLGLVFLKYISDRFQERRKAIESTLSDPISDDYIPNEVRREQFIESRDEYTSHNVFWVPADARWDSIQAKAKLPSIGQDIDKAMDLIEKENPVIRGVLPRNYGREGLDKGRLGQLVDLIGSIGLTETDDHRSDDVLGRVYEYFLGQFAGKETGKDAGAFYAPRWVVKLLVEMLEPYIDTAIGQLVNEAVAADQVIDIDKLAGVERPDLSILSDEFRDALAGKDRPNLQMGLLRRLLNHQIHTVQRTNLVQARKFSEQLEEAINKYTNRSLTTAEIIAELVKLAKQMRDDTKRHEELGLAEDEIAFYDAIATNDSAVLDLGDEVLKKIARELVTAVRASATIDWNLQDSVRAAMRAKVRRLLAKYDYLPDQEDKAVELVLEQAELFETGEAA